MNLRNLFAAVAALVLTVVAAAPAHAQAHAGHDPSSKCAWQADVGPQFVPGSSPVITSGATVRRSILFKTVVGRTSWTVVVLPAYHFGWVYAWDEGVPLESSCTKAYARSSAFNVLKTHDCCRPQRFAQATMSCTFRVRATQLNAPGMASAKGLTYIYARNSGTSCVTKAGTTTRSGDAGLPVTVQVPLPNGANARVSLNLDFDSEAQSVDSASFLSLGPTIAAPDEEYAIMTDLDLEATADGAPWDTAESTADLMQHFVWIRTVLECKHCSQKLSHQLMVYGTGEKSATGS